MTRSPDPGSHRPQRLPDDQDEAVEELFRAASPKLFRRALLLTQQNREEAEDLVQMVFQAAVTRWETIGHKDAGEQMAWLHKVLRNKAADFWRVNGRECPLTDLVLNQIPALQGPDQQVLSSIALERVLKVVNDMPPVRHRVAYLRLLAGFPTREVARMLGIKQSTVRGHFKEAMRDLRKEVGPMLPDIDVDPSAGPQPPEGQ